jgi:hypothetical protein
VVVLGVIGAMFLVHRLVGALLLKLRSLFFPVRTPCRLVRVVRVLVAPRVEITEALPRFLQFLLSVVAVVVVATRQFQAVMVVLVVVSMGNF